MNPKEVLEFAKKNDAKQIDLRFTDLPGSVPPRFLSDPRADGGVL